MTYKGKRTIKQKVLQGRVKISTGGIIVKKTIRARAYLLKKVLIRKKDGADSKKGKSSF